MVVDEITDLYRYPADKIDVVRNGVPLDKFRFDPGLREKSRAQLKLKQDQIALLFAGSGWERKGLLFAIEAMALCKNRKIQLVVAGRGNAKPYRTMRPRFWREDPVQFLGEVADLMPFYTAADSTGQRVTSNHNAFQRVQRNHRRRRARISCRQSGQSGRLAWCYSILVGSIPSRRSPFG
jgi:glycosyltransferase involved in cell wall biosynthesis